MDWVTEKEDWLLDWNDFRSPYEVSFGEFGPVTPVTQSQRHEVFFSDVIEAYGRCFVARACGSVVDLYDISPCASALVSWRVRLPSHVVSGSGISHCCSAQGDSVTLFLLSRAPYAVHRVLIKLGVGLPHLSAKGSTLLSLTSEPSAFVALDADFVALGCYNGSLQAFRLGTGTSIEGGYELTDSTLLRRLVGGLVSGSSPLVLALAAAGMSAGCYRLLSFSADGQLRLWELHERRGNIVATKPVHTATDRNLSLVGAASAQLRVSASNSRVCLLVRSAMFLLLLPPRGLAGGLKIEEVEAPFLGAVPSAVAISDAALWSIWSGVSREQLYRLDFDTKLEAAYRQLRALDSCGLDTGHATSSSSAMRQLVLTGCHSSASLAHRAVFTLSQQHDVWRAEEDSFDVLLLSKSLDSERHLDSYDSKLEDIGSPFNESFDRPTGLAEQALAWWVNRVLLPGRYSWPLVGAALLGAGASVKLGTADLEMPDCYSTLRTRLEEHLRKQALADAMPTSSALAASSAASPVSPLQAAASIGGSAADFLRICDSMWRRRHQVNSLCVSRLWAPHACSGLPPSQPAYETRAVVCPLLFCRGGVSCVRTVNSWPERWWTTLHMARDISNHEQMEIENVLELSPLIEWKLCVTAWFLSQCVCNASTSMAFTMLHRGSKPSDKARPFVDELPKQLEGHFIRCASTFKGSSLQQQLECLREALLVVACPRERRVQILDGMFDTSTGAWFLQEHPSAVASEFLLTDMFRGSIALAECEYASAAMRDLLLLCIHFLTRSTEHDSMKEVEWNVLSETLDEQIPRSQASHQAMRLHPPGRSSTSSGTGGLALRGCDLWAASFRAEIEGQIVCLRPPLGSFRGTGCALLLLRHECWDGLRWWSRHQPRREFLAFLAACEWLAHRRYESAKEVFLRAEGCAAEISACDANELVAEKRVPPVISYNERVAAKFAAIGRREEEFFFTRRAAMLAETQITEAADRHLHQHLWVATFERAVQLQEWEEACEALLHIDHYQSHLRILGQQLRASGNIQIVMKLPEKHKNFFLTSLYEHASMSSPTPGSDALACYNLLYALRFSSQEYLQAAGVAYLLYTALVSALESLHLPGLLRRRPWAQALHVDDGSVPEAGDSTSDPNDIPNPPSQDTQAERDDNGMQCDDAPRHDDSCLAKCFTQVWPLLEQQRAALLLLTSALSLTKEKVLVVPSVHVASTTPESTPSASGDKATVALSCDLWQLRNWFQRAEVETSRSVVTLQSAEQRLAVVAAQLVTGGRGEAGDPGDLAHCVAALGMLCLALQICMAYRLDVWRFAFRPFVRLCLAAESAPDEKVAALCEAACGPLQQHMFVWGDGGEPLRCAGDARAGLWRTVRDCLTQLCPRTDRAHGSLFAASVRLYSLVADEVLMAARPLPQFLVGALSEGPSWVCLLRLYMKHSLAEEAVSFLRAQLRRCGPPSIAAIARAESGIKWSPLQEFPVKLVMHLRSALIKQTYEERGNEARKGLLAELEAILTQFRTLLADASGSTS